VHHQRKGTITVLPPVCVPKSRDAKTPGLEIFTCKPNREVPTSRPSWSSQRSRSQFIRPVAGTFLTSLYSIEGTTSLPHFFRLSDALLDAKKSKPMTSFPRRKNDHFCNVPLFAFLDDRLQPCRGVYSPTNLLGDDGHEGC